MKIKEGFIIKKVMGSYMIVNTENLDSMNNMRTMNETGAFLWNLLTKDTKEDELIGKLMSEYEVDDSTARRDVRAFLESLKAADILAD